MSSEMVDMGRKPKADSELTPNARRVRRHEQKKAAETEALRSRVAEFEAREREEAELNELKRELDEHDAATPEAGFSIERYFSKADATELEAFRKSHPSRATLTDLQILVEFIRGYFKNKRFAEDKAEWEADRRARAAIDAIYNQD